MMGSEKIALSFSTLPSRETLRCPRTIAPDIAFEVATEIDRQRGEESLKRKIGDADVCREELPFMAAFVRRAYELRVSGRFRQSRAAQRRLTNWRGTCGSMFSRKSSWEKLGYK
jgi:hypothetical protein